MKFSIILPTWNNLKYLKICLDSIKRNSNYEHDINIHVHEGSDGTVEYLNNRGIKFNHSVENLGLCKGSNSAATLAETDYIIYTHDDMYFLPSWDFFLSEEVKKVKNNLYYFSGTMIGPIGCGLQNIDFNCGKTADEFNEKKLLSNYKNVEYFDHQGTHWAPHLIHKSIWKKIGGFSKEFDPGFASDTDLNMKLWINGVRLFKGLENCRVYHFSSVTLRKKTPNNNGAKTFLLKWGITIKFFKKYYLKTDTVFDGELKEPNKTFSYYINLLKCKCSFLYYYLLKKLKI